MGQNHTHLETSWALHVAGFVAIFIEAKYPTAGWSNAGFYSGTCQVMLRRLAVHITLGYLCRTDITTPSKSSQVQSIAWQHILEMFGKGSVAHTLGFTHSPREISRPNCKLIGVG